MTPKTVAISGAVEGIVDEAVLRRLAEDTGVAVQAVYGLGGKRHLRQLVPGYNQAARFAPWLIIVDLDRSHECAPALRTEWLPEPAPLMKLLVAVRAIEAWLLADRDAIADFLGVSIDRAPRDPEALTDPKRAMVDLARHSRRRNIREDMVARPESGRDVGPAYAARMIEFTGTLWRPAEAESRADSLRRCRQYLSGLVDGPGTAEDPL